MDTIKKNPLKFARISLVAYLVLNILGEILYAITCSIQYGENIMPLFSTYIFGLLPTVLLAIYLFAMINKSQYHPLLLVYYIISALFGLISIASLSTSLSYMFDYGTALFINFVFQILGLICSIFCMVDVIGKFKYIKITRMVLLVFYGISTVRIVINNVSNLANGISGMLSFSSFIQSLSSILFYIAILLLWFFIFKGQPKKENLEDTLINLKNLLENGIITEEEYKQRKAEILKKL